MTFMASLIDDKVSESATSKCKLVNLHCHYGPWH
jgi:hypothetical protein